MAQWCRDGIRPMPRVSISGFFVLCRRGPSCRGERCTFAHSEAEKVEWNKQIIDNQRQSAVVRHVFPLIPPVQPAVHQPDWFFDSRNRHSSGVGCATLNTSSSYAAAGDKFIHRLQEELVLSDVEVELARQNYKEKFHKLLCWEEKRHIEILEERCNGSYKFMKCANVALRESEYHNNYQSYGYINGIDGDKVTYVTQASERAVIIAPGIKNADILAVNHDHTEECLYLAFSSDVTALHSMTLAVEFELKHSYFDSLHRAINYLPGEVIQRIVPQKDQFCLGQKTSSMPVDQSRALELIRHCEVKSPPVVICGVFGSGKTYLLAKATHELVTKSNYLARILICTHHQGSADTFADQYFARGKPFELRNFFRVTSMKYRPKGQHYCKIQDFLKFANDRSVQVVVTTSLTALRLHGVVPRGFFTHIFLDEAAQAREPEAIAPLCLATEDTKIIMAGDWCQVGPRLLVLGNEARANGLDVSMLQRINRFYNQKVLVSNTPSVILLKNYRCHSGILELSSALFYNSQLSCARADESHPLAPYPLLFVCSSFDDTVQSCGESSDANEASIVLQQATRFLHKWPKQWEKNYCIMTSTRRQSNLIKRMIRKPVSHHNVNTVYNMQGQEYRALFLSTVEPTDENGKSLNPTKTPCDIYVFNTVLTRAQSLVVCVGNPFLLLKMERHMGYPQKCWAEYLNRCLEHNTIIFPPGVKNGLEKLKRYLKPLTRTAQESASAAPSIEKTHSPSVKRASQHPSAPPNALVPSNLQPVPPSTAGAAKKQTSKKKSAPKVTHSEYSLNVGEEEFPGLEASRKPESKRRKNLQPPAAPVSTVQTTKTIFPHSDNFIAMKRRFEEKPAFDVALSRESYRDKFRHLLILEEEEHERLLKNKCDGTYKLSLLSRHKLPEAMRYPLDGDKGAFRYGSLSGEKLTGEVIAYAIHASENKMYITINGHKLEASVVENPNPCVLYIAFHDEQFLLTVCPKAKTAITLDVSVTFILKYSYFNRLFTALNKINIVSLCQVLPQESDFACMDTGSVRILRPRFDCLLLDRCQLHALKMIMSTQSSAPVLVVGPFGTGKTRLLASAAYQIVLQDRNARVLICAHHQKSATVFIDKYFGPISSDPNHRCYIKFVRMVPSESYVYRAKSDHQKYYKATYKVKMMINRGNIPQILITTVANALYLTDTVPPGFFTHILIDEGAQTREPECIMPLCLADRSTKVVIAGDHCQVGPALVVLGEEPREHGLNVSLLERLHSLYDKIGGEAVKHCSTLVNNYRCHSGILRLSSSLFYESALQCEVSGDIAHPAAPYPLVFVCSSLDSHIVKEDVNNGEAILVLDQVKKYVGGDNWPEREWGKKSLSDICIITATSNQKQSILKKINSKKYKEIHSVDVINTYTMQGAEYRAVFLSTSEPMDESGHSLNPTKSVCNRYVFNTAVTRAKSLVVCVGNPFLLLKMEEQSEFKCWKEYLKRCMECSTFYHFAPNSQSAIKELQCKVFDDDRAGVSPSLDQSTSLDSILSAYTKHLEKFTKSGRKLKLRISSLHQTTSWQLCENNATNETDSPKEFIFKETLQCQLVVNDFYEAEAIPLDLKKKTVKIIGLNNRRGAFDGDIVEVGVFEDSPKDNQRGKVVGVVEGSRDIRFVCRVDPRDPLSFLPVDRKTPKFKNLPKLSGSIRDEDSIEAELKAKNVVVFDPEWDGESLPKVVDVIPPSTAKNMLFVIKFVCWNLKYRLPLGIAIAALPKSLSIFHSERLLKLAHGIEDDSMSEPYDNICIKQDSSLPSLCQNAFTIDPEGAEDLDDAISLELVKSSDESEVYLLGVHIVNVAKHVENGSIVDRYAKNRGISNYWTAEKRKKCRNMLPKEICKGLSLLPNKLRDVFTITMFCTKKNGQMTFSFSEAEVKRAQIKSQIQLTYKDAQMHMEKQVDISSLETLEKISKLKFCNVLKQLYQIAVQMYNDRLETSSISYSISEEGEEEFWQAHFLIQELMIWANSVVARKIHSKFPCSALLRRQPSPEDEKKAAMVGQHSLVVGYSHSCSLNSLVKTPPLGNMLVMPSTLKQIEEALKKDNMALLSYLLTNDQLYPQLAAASAHLVSIQQRAEYCCTSQDLDAITDFYRHYSLHLASYTHFTSPIRRYIDIEVQRMLIAILNEKTSEECFDLASHKNLCRFLNTRSREAKLFERKMNKTVLALECTSCSIESYAFVTQIHNKSIELSFPQQRIDKILGLKEKKFSLKSLNSLYRKAISSEGSEKRENQKLFTWKIKMTSFESPASIFESVLFSSVNEGELGEDDEGIQLDAFCPAEGEKPGTLKISSYRATAASKVSKIPKTTWMQVKTEAQKLAQSSTPLQATQSPIIHSLLLDHLPKNSQSSQSNSVCKSLSFPLMVYYLKQTINPYDLLKVWITWSLREEVAAPAIQLVELAPFVHICVQHNTHPAECFSDTNLSYASHKKYNSIKEYVGLWEKLLIAESSEMSVKEFQPIIIRDVHLKWPTLEVPPNCGDELYYEPNGSVIMKPPAQFMKQSSDFFEMSMGDMVCVRYGVQPESPNKAVYHLVTTAITKTEKINKDTGKKEEEMEVEMSFIGKNKRISEQMAKVLRNGEQSPKSEIQLIPMTASYQRTYRRIKTIGRNGCRVSHLCTQVALGIEENRKVESHIKALQILKSDKLARRLWKLDKPLNEVQLEAMELALENRFQLIQGPPGTGKSETGAHLAYIFQRLNKELNHPNDHWHCVMYCGPSNKSVDVVLRKLDELNEKLQGNRLNILRIYASVIEKREFEGPESSSSPHQADYVCPDYAKRYALHHKIRDDPSGTRIKIYEKEFKSLDKKFVIGSQQRKEYEKCIAEAKESLLKRERFDIILCTCNEASGKLVENHVFPRQCIVDECGMTCEPECLSAISLCEHVVLLGDHKQLQHVVDYRPARICGLNISLFQRYAEHFREKCKTLEIQYRMHQAIQDFPSEHFYGSKLRPGDFVKKREEPKLKNVWPVPTKPIVFCNVVGEEGDNKLWSPGRRKKVMLESKFNSQEAAKAVKIAKALHVDNKIPLDQIAFLTPYSAQEEHLKDVAKEAGLFNEDGGQSVKICSINKSQGDEFGFVILSTVRSQPLELIANPNHIQPDLGWIHENIGFVSDEHQINVGITRSKHGLFIIGNKRLLEYDYTWKKLLGHYEEEGCIVDGFRYPRRSS